MCFAKYRRNYGDIQVREGFSSIPPRTIDSGLLVKIMDETDAELTKEMGSLGIGPEKLKTPRNQSNGLFNVKTERRYTGATVA